MNKQPIHQQVLDDMRAHGLALRIYVSGADYHHDMTWDELLYLDNISFVNIVKSLQKSTLTKCEERN